MQAPAAIHPPHHDRRASSYEEYLALPDDGRIVERVEGEIVFHMPPTTQHQDNVSFLITLLWNFVSRLALGRVLIAPFEVKLWPGGPSREPDILYVSRERLDHLTDRRFEGAPDLVVEVVSPASVTTDRVDKYLEYERAGVREYWIIDPRPRQEQADFFARGEHGRFVAGGHQRRRRLRIRPPARLSLANSLVVAAGRSQRPARPGRHVGRCARPLRRVARPLPGDGAVDGLISFLETGFLRTGVRPEKLGF